MIFKVLQTVWALKLESGKLFGHATKIAARCWKDLISVIDMKLILHYINQFKQTNLLYECPLPKTNRRYDNSNDNDY
jgi:hypothetical protein